MPKFKTFFSKTFAVTEGCDGIRLRCGGYEGVWEGSLPSYMNMLLLCCPPLTFNPFLASESAILKEGTLRTFPFI